MKAANDPETARAEASQEGALDNALGALFQPLARLCLAKGFTYAAAEELLKQAFVDQAAALQPGAPAHGTVSRVSTATGINRREVTRLIRPEAPQRSAKPPIATEIFARWTTAPVWRDKKGHPLTLRRQGPAPSFEALAHSVTRDVHPRSMLEELIRLNVAAHDEESDSVTLLRKDFVPLDDDRDLLDFLGDNVGDHLAAAVENVLPAGKEHLEQAVFADELSSDSLEELHELVADQWQALREALVPAITAMIEKDRTAGKPQDQRVRIGLYSFSQPAARPGSHAEIHKEQRI